MAGTQGTAPAAEPQGIALGLITACYTGADVEAVLDEADTRAAALGCAWLLARIIRLSGLPPAEYLAQLRVAILSAHLRQPAEAEEGGGR